MASLHYGDLSYRGRVPLHAPNDKEYTRDPSFGNPLSSATQDEPLFPPNYDDDNTSFSLATTVEGYSSDSSFTFTVSDGGSSQSGFIPGNNHTKSEAAPMVTEDPEISFKNNSPSGTLNQTSRFKFKYLNRSLPNLVSASKRPWHHRFTTTEDIPPIPHPFPPPSKPASSGLDDLEVVTLPSIWLTAPTPREQGFSSSIVLAEVQTPPSARSSLSSVVIYKPSIAEVPRTYHHLEEKPLPTLPTGSQRKSVIGAFVGRLRDAIGLKGGSIQTSHHHSYDRDRSGVEKKARLPSPRIRTDSFGTTMGGRSITTKQAVDHQPYQAMARHGAGEIITDGEAHQLSSFKIGRPNYAPSTERRNIIDLKGMATEFVKVEDTKRSGTGSGVGSGRRRSGSKHSPSPV